MVDSSSRVRCLFTSFRRADISAQQVSYCASFVGSLARCFADADLAFSACRAAQQLADRQNHPEDSLVKLTYDGAYFIGQVNGRGQPHGQGVAFNPDGSEWTA